MGTARRQFTDDFKRQAVGLLASSGRPLNGRVIVCESVLLGSEAVVDGLSDSIIRPQHPKSSAMT